MTREVYEALKTRLTVKFPRLGTASVYFDNSGLNEGIGCFEERFIDSIIAEFKSERFNLWNASQRIHWIVRQFVPNCDARLLANPIRK